MLRPGSLQLTPPLRPASFPASSRARWRAVDITSITAPVWHKYLQSGRGEHRRAGGSGAASVQPPAHSRNTFWPSGSGYAETNVKRWI